MFTKPTSAGYDYPTQIGRLVDVVEGPARRNWVRNGDFMVAQRGTSFAGLTADQYTLDGWVAGAGGTNTITQQSFTVGQTDVPGNPINFLRVQRTVAAGAANNVCWHPIELLAHFSGKTVTVSFYAKVASATKALVFDLYSSGVTPAVDTADNSFTASTTWTLIKATISVPAMTAATSAAYLALRIREAASFGTFTFDIADVMVEFGSEATSFERLSMEQQVSWAQRFFSKSFAYGTAPAQNAGFTSAIAWTCVAANAVHTTSVRFPIAMRTAPTVTLYNPAAANAQARNTIDVPASDYTSTTASNISEIGFIITATSAGTAAAGDDGAVHYSATAEL